MIPRDFDKWPGVGPSVLASDVHLLRGDRSAALTHCQEAWALGDAAALASLAALGSPDLLVDEAARISTHVRTRRIGRAQGRDLARLVLAVLTQVHNDPAAALKVIVAVLPVMPALSFPLLRIADGDGGEDTSVRAQAVQAMRARAAELTEDRARLHLLLRSNFLAATAVDDVGSVPTGQAGSRDAAAAYLVLRCLDRLDDRSTGGELLDTLDEDADSLERDKQKRQQLTVTLRQATELAGPGDIEAYRLRLSRALAAMGDHAAQDAQLALVAKSEATVASIALEERQRAIVRRGDLALAAKIAEKRAEAATGSWRSALLMLALEYAATEGSDTRRSRDLAEALLAAEPVKADMPMDVARRLAFEVLEGCLLVDRDLPALEYLWTRFGAFSHDGTPHVPDRSIEHAIMTRVGGDARTAEKLPTTTRRFLATTALAEGDAERAAALLAASDGNDNGEPASRAAIQILQQARSHGAQELFAEAMDELERHLSTVGVVGDLLPVHLFRWGCELAATPDRSATLADTVAESLAGGTRATILASSADDLLTMRHDQDALVRGRAAFEADPTSRFVRGVYRRAAERLASDEDLAMAATVVDDEDLMAALEAQGTPRRVFELARHGTRTSKQETRDAIGTLRRLAQDMTSDRLKAAMLRAASEVSLDELGDDKLALQLAQEGLRLMKWDVLLSRHMLKLHLRNRQWSDAGKLMKSAPAPIPLDDEAASALLKAATRVYLDGDFKLAFSLLRASLGGLDRRQADDNWDQALTIGESLAVSLGETTPWYDILTKLEKGAGPSLHSELLVRRARLLDKHMGQRTDALDLYEDALAHSRDRRAIFRLLIEAQRAEEDQQAVAALLERLVQDLEEEGGREHAALETALAELGALRQQLGETSQAITTYRRLATLRRNDPGPRRLLARLAAVEGDLAGQVHHLEMAARLTGDTRARGTLHLQAADVYAELGEEAKAAEHAMVSFICDPSVPSTFARVKDAYEKARRWTELVRLYDMAIENAERQRDAGYDLELLYAEKAQVEWRRLGRGEAAAKSLLGALEHNPAEAEYIEILEVIAARQSIARQLERAYQLQLEAVPRQERKQLLIKLGELVLQRGDTNAAESTFRTVLTTWPDSETATRRLEQLAERTRRWNELTEFLDSLLERLGDKPESANILRCLAGIRERELGDLDGALKAYERVVAIEPTLHATSALSRLLEATRDWPRLLEISQREAELTDDPEQKARVFFRMGSIHETQLNDDVAAMKAYAAALSIDPGCIPALHGARELHRRANQYELVMASFESELSLWDEPQERAGILVRMSRVAANHLAQDERAERLIQRALEVAPDLPATLSAYVEFLMDRERPDEAEPHATSLVEVSRGRRARDRSSALLWLSRVEHALERPQRSLDALGAAIELDPHNMTAVDSLIRVLEQTEPAQTTPAAGSLVLTTFADRHAVELDLAEATLATLQRRGDHRRVALLRAAVAGLYERAGDLERAEQDLRTLASEQPSHEAASLLVEFLKRWRRFEDALTVWASYLDSQSQRRRQSGFDERADVDLAAIHLELANLLMDWLGRPEEAAQHFDRAIVLDPDNTAAMFQAAQCYGLLGRWHRALRTLRRVTQGVPGRGPSQHAVHHYYEGWLLSHCGTPRKPLECWKRAVELDPDDPRPRLLGARALVRRNLLDEAAAMLEGSQAPVVVLEHALVTARKGQHEEAAQELRTIISSCDQADVVATAQFRLLDLAGSLEGGAEAALTEMRALLAAHPNNRDAIVAVGQLYESIGQNHAARSVASLAGALGVPRDGALDGDGPQGVAVTARALQHVVLSSLQSPEAQALACLELALSSAAHHTERPPASPLSDEVVGTLSRELGMSHRKGQVLLAEGVVVLTWGTEPTGPWAAVPMESDERVGATVTFLAAKALAELSTGLVPCRVLGPEGVADAIRTLHRAAAGFGSPPDYIAESGGDTAWQRALDAIRLGNPQPEISPERSRTLADQLLHDLSHYGNRWGYLACNDPGVAIDAIVGLSLGEPYARLTPDQRGTASCNSPSVVELVNWIVGPHHADLLEPHV